MKRPNDRRTVLIAAGVAALAAATGTVAAQPTNLFGQIKFAGDRPVPEGSLQIHLEDTGIQDTALRRLAQTHLTSSGSAKTIDFSLMWPKTDAISPGLQIVARLTRPDGWLIARGSAPVGAAPQVTITLKDVVY